MKTKHLFLAAVALLIAAGGLWFARSPRQTEPAAASQKSKMTEEGEAPHEQRETDQVLHAPARLLPPDPVRRFRDFTPEQRVEFARKGHGPGG
jgi:hypothetical protein